MPKTEILLENTNGSLEKIGEPVRADGWYGHIDGLYTLAIYIVNFTGRIAIEGSISVDPSDDDWFPIKINGCNYLQYPMNESFPTDFNGSGDTGVFGFTFKANLVWIRARVVRDYLDVSENDLDEIANLGIVNKILISR